MKLFKVTFLILCHMAFGLKGQSPNPIAKSSQEVKSINPVNTDYSDLDFLKEKIGDSRIVFLGETSSDEGSTLAAKTRLTQFLHKEMGFEVLALEVGFYDAFFCNQQLQTETIDIREAKNQITRGDAWDTDVNASQIFFYARHSWLGSAPLNIAGFDISKPPTGADHYLTLISEIIKEHPDLELDERKSALMNNVIEGICGYIGNSYSKKLNFKSYTKASNIVAKMIEEISSNHNWKHVGSSLTHAEKELFFLKSLFLDIEIAKQGVGSYTWDLIRNKSMADRLEWLVDYFYPGKKLIVWASTKHLKKYDFEMSYDKNKYADAQVSSFKMGDFLNYKVIGKDIYHIGFTTYSGERGVEYPNSYMQHESMSSTRKITEVTDNSYEYRAHQLGYEFLFTDIKGSPSNSWIKGPEVKLHLFENNFVGPIYKMFDGLFFIDKMEPSIRIEKGK